MVHLSTSVNSSLAEGVNVGVGYGKIANAGGGTTGSDEDAHYTAFATYTAGGISAGYQMSVVGDNTQGGADEEATGWSIAANVMDGLSVSYGEEIEFMNPSSARYWRPRRCCSYNGICEITVQQNETSNNGGGSTSDEMTEIALSLSF